MELDDEGREVVMQDHMRNLIPLCPNCHSLAAARAKSVIFPFNTIRKSSAVPMGISANSYGG